MVIFYKFGEDSGHESSPELVEGVVQTDRSFVSEVTCILFERFMYEDRFGFFPVVWGDACYPEADEEVVYG